ncbi:MAG: hypothetical protein ABL971_12310 [Vicinamibacterales bacterium]
MPIVCLEPVPRSTPVAKNIITVSMTPETATKADGRPARADHQRCH